MGEFRKNKEKGQILLVVVLAAVISLTVGLSVVSRTLTNSKITTEEVNSQKALSAAEAGVEQLVQDNTLATSAQGGKFTKTLGGATFTATVSDVSGKEILLNGGKPISPDDGVDIWLSSYPNYASATSPTLTLYWNDSAPIGQDCPATSFEVAVISGPIATPAMNHYAYDKCAADGNNFTNTGISKVDTTIQGVKFNRKVALPAIATGRIARVVPYSSTAMAVISSNVSLPAQGVVIDSQGISGNTSRKIRAYQAYPKLPTEYFPYTLFVP